MNLYTESGILKESVECAPNGYFFLPVYDKGTYVLAVASPDGWTFGRLIASVIALLSHGDHEVCAHLANGFGCYLLVVCLLFFFHALSLSLSLSLFVRPSPTIAEVITTISLTLFF
jgi:BOS complex subunit NOMO1-like, first beta sandwich domain